MKPLVNLYVEIISLENLFCAAKATLARGRRFRDEGAEFKFNLEREVLKLHDELAGGKYRHGKYRLFTIRDPKARTIAAASIRDRVLHHAVHDVIAPRIDRIFVHDSYACRKGKGTHRALDRAHHFLRANKYAVHLDVMSYFSNIDHATLKGFLARYIADERLMKLLDMIIDSTVYLARNEDRRRGCEVLRDAGQNDGSLHAVIPAQAGIQSCRGNISGFPIKSGMTKNIQRSHKALLRPVAMDSQLLLPGWELFEEEPRLLKGVPLGNLTSQFFANLYLNELDQYIKHNLKARCYVRYMDDMLLFSNDKIQLLEWERVVRTFAKERLRLELHPTSGPQPVKRGITFLGFRLFPAYRKLKRTSVSRFIRRMNDYTKQYSATEGGRERYALLKTISASVWSFNAHALNGNTFRLRKLLYDRFPLIDQREMAGMNQGGEHYATAANY